MSLFEKSTQLSEIEHIYLSRSKLIAVLIGAVSLLDFIMLAVMRDLKILPFASIFLIASLSLLFIVRRRKGLRAAPYILVVCLGFLNFVINSKGLSLDLTIVLGIFVSIFPSYRAILAYAVIAIS
ncbi:hypothetical protein [Paenibacillus hexagrammi]|uniref:Uncharacterized protein n=1 Tax=Paenibacillus hexagrammi TaxID=2908839 RepID=A0ABY3SPK8_9BACL|nr:hypothetical protein [Paenibacillus sp. YPD9-1]UJF35891.1 hypothetical protein L0M14_12885 [Paenibacillus sp. YPD9-1]